MSFPRFSSTAASISPYWSSILEQIRCREESSKSGHGVATVVRVMIGAPDMNTVGKLLIPVSEYRDRDHLSNRSGQGCVYPRDLLLHLPAPLVAVLGGDHPCAEVLIGLPLTLREDETVIVREKWTTRLVHPLQAFFPCLSALAYALTIRQPIRPRL
ncbi:hypothetical protein VTK56DRAFT_9125 [Thermocarpiscus australiensis]